MLWPVLQGFHLGDSAKHEQKKTWQTFFAEVERCKDLETPWTLELRDPLANSFVSSVLEDPRKDPRMQVWIPTSAPMIADKDAMTSRYCLLRQPGAQAAPVPCFLAAQRD